MIDVYNIARLQTQLAWDVTFVNMFAYPLSGIFQVTNGDYQGRTVNLPEGQWQNHLSAARFNLVGAVKKGNHRLVNSSKEPETQLDPKHTITATVIYSNSYRFSMSFPKKRRSRRWNITFCIRMAID